MDASLLQGILWRNQGQVLTPELIVGILQGASFQPDKSFPPDTFQQGKCGSFTFQLERLVGIVDEIHPLHVEHWEETEKHRHGIELNYDYAALIAAERDGRYLQFTVRKDGELVGYSGMLLHVSTHTQTFVATEDSLFLRATCRGGRTALRFIDYVEKSLGSIGVREIRLSTKTLNTASKLLMKCGFEPVATQLVKILGVPHES